MNEDDRILSSRAKGEEVIIPTPAWPNYAGPLRLQGSRPVEVPMTFGNNKWNLDLGRLFDLQ